MCHGDRSRRGWPPETRREDPPLAPGGAFSQRSGGRPCPPGGGEGTPLKRKLPLELHPARHHLDSPATSRWPDLDRRRKGLRLPGFDYSDPNHVFFVTVCARHLSHPFSDSAIAGEVTGSILFLSSRNECRLYAYCLMTDHLHLALAPVQGRDGIPRLLQRFKSYTTRLAWQHGIHGTLWQQNYYDHIARGEEDVKAMCQYIMLNPVRKGLVDDPAKWPYSGMPHPLPG